MVLEKVISSQSGTHLMSDIQSKQIHDFKRCHKTSNQKHLPVKKPCFSTPALAVLAFERSVFFFGPPKNPRPNILNGVFGTAGSCHCSMVDLPKEEL